MSDLKKLAKRLMTLDDRIIACMKCGMCQAVCPMFGATMMEADVARGKLALVDSWCFGAAQMDPLPYIQLDGVTLLTDGHTRAVWAHLHGETKVPCYPDPDPLDRAAYAQDLAWCRQEGVLSIEALAGRIVSHKDYERLWRKRCMEK